VPRVSIHTLRTPKRRLIKAVDEVREELAGVCANCRPQAKLVEAQRLEQRTRFDLEMMNEMVLLAAGIENYRRYLSRAPGEPAGVLYDTCADAC